jgi:hypothetical protein
MAVNFFYVYALKDPRNSPAMPFYIGKGAGSRAFDHLVTPDSTRKYSKIKEIVSAGFSPLVDILLDDLTEDQALRMEAEVISAFGTIESGGPLTNSVLPSGFRSKAKPSVVVPHGSVERAQLGLQFIEAAVFSLAQANPQGVTNSDTASALGLRSDYRGKQKDYLSYSILGLLLRDGRLERDAVTKRHKARGSG